MGEKRGKILVIRGGAIGDFILTLPAVAALRAAFPQTSLEVLGYPKVAQLARAAGVIDAFRSIEARPLARFFARDARLDDEWGEYFASFHLIISYLYDPDGIFKTNVGRVSKAHFIEGRHRPDESAGLHATAVFLQPLEKLAIYDADPAPRLALAPPARLEGRWLAAHPGSGSEQKNWPEEKWRELAGRVAAGSDTNLLLVGGEAERERVHRLHQGLPPTRARLAHDLPLDELARLIAAAGAFVGHDSGITHIAAALDVPVLVLWGPSNERIWRPLNPKVEILKSPDGLASIPVDEVLTRLERAGSGFNGALFPSGANPARAS